MSTIQEQILSRLETTLERVDETNGRVYRSRQEAIQRDECPAIVFEPVTCTLSDPYTTPHLVWNFNIRFTIIARGCNDKSPEEIADDVLLDMHSKIYADTTLEALCISIYPRTISYQFTEGDNNAVAVICDYEFLFRTSLEDLTSLN